VEATGLYRILATTHEATRCQYFDNHNNSVILKL